MLTFFKQVLKSPWDSNKIGGNAMIDTCISSYIAALADYGVRTGLIEPSDRTWAVNLSLIHI